MSFSRHNSDQNVNPFELPEIMYQIAKNVLHGDIVSCALVSKEWYQVFMLQLWKGFRFSRSKTLPAKSAVSKNAYFVSSLTFHEGMPRYIPNIIFPKLQKVVLTGSSRRKSEFSIQLLSNHPTIEDITIRYQSFHCHVTFWEALSNLPKLKRIHIAGYHMEPGAVSAFWRTLCQLECAIFQDSKFCEAILSQSATPLKLKHLALLELTTPQQELILFEKCIALESLNWSSSLSGLALVTSITEQCWPNLHKIQISSIKLNNISLQQILSSVKMLTDLIVGNADWGPESFNALSRHFGTLELLEDWHAGTFTSVMVNTVMCSCPNLRELTAGAINGLDIINDNQMEVKGQQRKGWICNHLRILRVVFDLRGVDSQIPILEKIAGLKQLSELNMRSKSAACPSISLTVSDGLDILKSLKFLKFVRIPGADNNTMTEEDVEWILYHWRRLDKLYGVLHHDPGRWLELQKILRKHKIDTM